MHTSFMVTRFHFSWVNALGLQLSHQMIGECLTFLRKGQLGVFRSSHAILHSAVLLLVRWSLSAFVTSTPKDIVKKRKRSAAG